MTDALILWALGQSKHLRWLKDVYEARMLAKLAGSVPVRIRGIRDGGDEFELDGVLRKVD